MLEVSDSAPWPDNILLSSEVEDNTLSNIGWEREMDLPFFWELEGDFLRCLFWAWYLQTSSVPQVHCFLCFSLALALASSLAFCASFFFSSRPHVQTPSGFAFLFFRSCLQIVACSGRSTFGFDHHKRLICMIACCYSMASYAPLTGILYAIYQDHYFLGFFFSILLFPFSCQIW